MDRYINKKKAEDFAKGMGVEIYDPLVRQDNWADSVLSDDQIRDIRSLPGVAREPATERAVEQLDLYPKLKHYLKKALY